MFVGREVIGVVGMSRFDGDNSHGRGAILRGVGGGMDLVGRGLAMVSGGRWGNVGGRRFYVDAFVVAVEIRGLVRRRWDWVGDTGGAYFMVV